MDSHDNHTLPSQGNPTAHAVADPARLACQLGDGGAAARTEDEDTQPRLTATHQGSGAAGALRERQCMSAPEPLPVAVHREPYVTFARLLPGADTETVTDVRRAFCVWLNQARLRFGTWQAAWNHFIGPRGLVHYTPAHCRTCKGRGFVALAVCGAPVCPACHGRRRGATVLLPAQRAAEPAA